MFSTTIKRSVATLGVVAGLLAAVGPASAQLPATTVVGVTTPHPGSKAPAGVSGKEMTDAVKAPAANTVFTSVSNVFKGEMIGLEPDYAIAITVDAGSGNDNLRGEAIDIIP